jgi:hypothetical protein
VTTIPSTFETRGNRLGVITQLHERNGARASAAILPDVSERDATAGRKTSSHGAEA